MKDIGIELMRKYIHHKQTRSLLYKVISYLVRAQILPYNKLTFLFRTDTL